MDYAIHWDERYRSAEGTLPWDTGEVATELKECFRQLDLSRAKVLELGCGTGTNAIWMAQQDCDVIATDVSPTAIEAAKDKAIKAKVNVKFMVSDIAAANPVQPGSVQFVFDRGVFHVMDLEHRVLFVERVAEALTDRGYWLCLAGSKDQFRKENEPGPPQLTAGDIVTAVESKFAIHKLERTFFVLPDNSHHLSWSVLMQKR